MYPLNRRASERAVPVRLAGFGVFDDQELAMDQPWDLVVLALSSVALRSGDWFPRLAARLGKARLLVLQPSLEDRDLVLAHVPAERVVYGMLAVISFQAPLPGDSLPEPGVAYWFPWLSGIGFSGAPAPVEEVTSTLKRGGMPVTRVADVHAEVAFVGAILDKTVAAVECADWSFERLRRDPELLWLATRSMRECWALAEARTGRKTPLQLRLVRPFALRLILALAPLVLPLDLEAFFHYHYVKVGEQTLLLQEDQLARFAAAGIPCPATAELAARIRRGRDRTSRGPTA
jgi:2-dehydropantoate 2-reductase